MATPLTVALGAGLRPGARRPLPLPPLTRKGPLTATKPTPKPDPKMRPPPPPEGANLGRVTIDEKDTPVPPSLIPVVGKPGATRAPGKPGTVPVAGPPDRGAIERALYPPGTRQNYTRGLSKPPLKLPLRRPALTPVTRRVYKA